MNDQRTLVLIDDEPDITECIKDNLAKYSFNILAYNNPIEALEKTSFHDVHTVLCDMNMPGLSGIQVFEALIKRDYKCPFVFLTAYPSEEFLNKALTLGVFTFLDKPFSSDTLSDVLLKALEVGARIHSTEKLMSDLRSKYLTPEEFEKYDIDQQFIKNLKILNYEKIFKKGNAA